jgi:hypothetical protein
MFRIRSRRDDIILLTNDTNILYNSLYHSVRRDRILALPDPFNLWPATEPPEALHLFISSHSTEGNKR